MYFKPESNCYQAQVSVNRRNIRGPPRQTLEEAISDRQRLLVAKAQGEYTRIDKGWNLAAAHHVDTSGRAEEEVVLLKVDYQRTLALEGCVGGLMPGERSAGDRRARGRPKGSVSGATRYIILCAITDDCEWCAQICITIDAAWWYDASGTTSWDVPIGC